MDRATIHPWIPDARTRHLVASATHQWVRHQPATGRWEAVIVLYRKIFEPASAGEELLRNRPPLLGLPARTTDDALPESVACQWLTPGVADFDGD